MVYQIGLPPRRIDLLTSVSGVDFDLAWRGHVEVEGLAIPFIGRNEPTRPLAATKGSPAAPGPAAA
jgi:hypothetical protein